VENGSNPLWPSFSTIVASGANGAIPHGDPENDGAGPKQVLPGDVVVIDLGGRVNDWVSDVTRSYVIGGTTNATVLKAYMAVHDAQNLTFPLIEAGTPAWALDDIARTHIEEQGFGDEFIHSLGHGPTTRSSGYPTTSSRWPPTMPSPLNRAFTSTVGLGFELRMISLSIRKVTSFSPLTSPVIWTGS
jgi:Xaa-Pro aminopeptidase